MGLAALSTTLAGVKVAAAEYMVTVTPVGGRIVEETVKKPEVKVLVGRVEEGALTMMFPLETETEIPAGALYLAASAPVSVKLIAPA